MSVWIRGRTLRGQVAGTNRSGLNCARRVALVIVAATGVVLALCAGLLIAPGAATADEWSGSSELSSPSTRDAEQLVIDANPLGDLVAGWKQSADDDIAAMFKAFDGSPGAPQEYVGDYDDPDIAIGGSSVGVLAFEDGTGSTSIHAASKGPGATTFTAAIPFSGDGHVSPAASPNAANPSVAVNGMGTGMLFFERDSYNPPSYSDVAEAIEGRILTNPGTNTWNAGADLNSVVYDPRAMEVSVAPDGSAFLGISIYQVGPCWGLDTAVLENDGTGSSNPDQFALTCAGNRYAGVYPSNARLPNNDVVMAYRNNQEDSVKFLDLSKARASAGSTNLSASEVRLDEVGGTQRTNNRVLVRTDAAGNTLVAWYDDNDAGVSNPQSMLARFRPSGGIFGPAEVISSGEDYSGEFDLDMDAAGNAYIVYGRTTGANEEIVAAERAAGASGWSTPELLSENQGTVDHPQVAAGRNGQAFASWIANPSDDVFYAENSAPQCSDGIDNDSDGQTDYPADPGCTGPDDDSEIDPVVGPDPVCSDGIDNDSDGKTDFPADPGCTSATDGSEADQVVVPPGSACDKATKALKKAKKQVKTQSKKVKKAKKKVKKSSGKKKKRAKKKLKKQKKKLKKAQKKKKRLKQKKKGACSS